MRSSKRTLSLMFALLGWFAIIAQLILMFQNTEVSFLETAIRFLSFFTILTNILVALFFTVQVPGTKKFNAGTLTAVAVYITIVGLVYQVLLRHLWAPTGMQKIVDELLHAVMPVLTIFYWFWYEEKRNVLYRQIIWWLVYPLVYLGYILIRGHFSGFYPYPFIDVATLGLAKVLFNAFFLFVLFGFISFVFVLAGKQFKKAH
ncbi:MAG: hypothetical protein BGO55_29750 [Sphingobacteriales bacterium 50-39]|nr:Pr6Pr family membrane protein [Sphingobacteriales bacterium]OJW60719.1 MAG: hypothetical protein BGO55_29750 [Sphingobacteriales bacterium 50-39]